MNNKMDHFVHIYTKQNLRALSFIVSLHLIEKGDFVANKTKIFVQKICRLYEKDFCYKILNIDVFLL